MYPDSAGASRKRNHKLAECALFDSGTLCVEFQPFAYDHTVTEARAAAGGWRLLVVSKLEINARYHPGWSEWTKGKWAVSGIV